jgi:hypothetical protein
LLQSKLSGEGLGWLKRIFNVQPGAVAEKLVTSTGDFSRCRKVNEPEEYFCLEMQTTYEGNGFRGTRKPQEAL